MSYSIYPHEGHIESEGTSTVQILRMARRFLATARRVDPQRYREVMKRYPVQQNVRRDEKAREVSLEVASIQIDRRTARETEWD
jgi:hypothetical protein